MLWLFYDLKHKLVFNAGRYFHAIFITPRFTKNFLGWDLDETAECCWRGTGPLGIKGHIVSRMFFFIYVFSLVEFFFGFGKKHIKIISIFAPIIIFIPLPIKRFTVVASLVSGPFFLLPKQALDIWNTFF